MFLKLTMFQAHVTDGLEPGYLTNVMMRFCVVGGLCLLFTVVVVNFAPFNFQDEKYIHIEAEEMKKLDKHLTEKTTWYETKLNITSKQSLYDTPLVYASQIYQTRIVSNTGVQHVKRGVGGGGGGVMINICCESAIHFYY